jgi:hypothetical protein
MLPAQVCEELRFPSLFQFSSGLDSPMVGNNHRKSEQGEAKKAGKDFHTVYLRTETCLPKADERVVLSRGDPGCRRVLGVQQSDHRP